MSFMLVRQPLDDQCEPLAEAEHVVIELVDVIMFLMTVLDPVRLADNGKQVRLIELGEASVTVLHMRYLGFNPFSEEDITPNGLLWWSYDFTDTSTGNRDFVFIRKLLGLCSESWSSGLKRGVYTHIIDKLASSQTS